MSVAPPGSTRYWLEAEPWRIEIAKRRRRRKVGELPRVDRRVKGRKKRP